MMMLRTRPPSSARRKDKARARGQARAESGNGHIGRSQSNTAREEEDSAKLALKALIVLAIILFVIGVILVLIDTGTTTGISGAQIAGILLILAAIGIVGGIIGFCVYRRRMTKRAAEGSNLEENGRHVNSVSRHVRYDVEHGAVASNDPSGPQNDIYLEFGRRDSGTRPRQGGLNHVPDIRISHEPDHDAIHGQDPDLREIGFDIEDIANIETDAGLRPHSIPPIDLSRVSPSPPSPRKSFENPAYDSGDEEVPADYSAPPRSDRNEFDSDSNDRIHRDFDDRGPPEGQSQNNERRPSREGQMDPHRGSPVPPSLGANQEIEHDHAGSFQNTDVPIH